MNKIALLLGLVAFSNISLADETNWVGGVNAHYFNFTNPDSLDSSNFGMAVASIGFKKKFTDKFSMMPELRAGLGFTEDYYSNETITGRYKMDRIFAVSLRAQYEIDELVHIFAASSYTDYKLSDVGDKSSRRFSHTLSEDTMSLEFGLGFNLTQSLSVEASFEHYGEQSKTFAQSDMTAYRLGLKHKF